MDPMTIAMLAQMALGVGQKLFGPPSAPQLQKTQGNPGGVPMATQPMQSSPGATPTPMQNTTMPGGDFSGAVSPNNVPSAGDYMLPQGEGPASFGAYMDAERANKLSGLAQGFGQAAQGAQLAQAVIGSAPPAPRLNIVSPPDNLGSVSQQLLEMLRREMRRGG